MSFVGVIKQILSKSDRGLTPQQVRDIVKREYPDYYGTEAHHRNVEKGHYKDLDHALLAQIYSSTKNSSQIDVDKSDKPVKLTLADPSKSRKVGRKKKTNALSKKSLAGAKLEPEPSRPTASLVRSFIEQWTELESYSLQERSLGLLFHELCPRNDHIEHVLLKVSALNDFYSTNIFDTFSVAKHIFEKKIDERLVESDYELVNEIALVSIKGKVKNNYSFASKYCSHHRPEIYPVYDSFVEKMLLHYKSVDDFDRFAKPDLKQYRHFVQIVQTFQKYYELDDFSLREIDIFLWLAGKKWFPRSY